MARLALIFIVALVNLGLGFAIAIKAGRGPWSRHARRLAMNPAPSTEEAPESDVHVSAEAAPRTAKPIEQIADDLDALESRVHKLQQRLAAGEVDSQAVEELRSTIRDGVTQIEALDVANAIPEYPEQATAGLYALQVVLETVASDLGESGENRKGEPDLNTAATRVLMACREAGVVFNGLRFAELPA
jgi:anti-sigma28 factor (negative regulator of flagellin synthesis)